MHHSHDLEGSQSNLDSWSFLDLRRRGNPINMAPYKSQLCKGIAVFISLLFVSHPCSFEQVK